MEVWGFMLDELLEDDSDLHSWFVLVLGSNVEIEFVDG